MYKIISFFIVYFFIFNCIAQSSIQFKATSIRPGDSCTVIIQKSSENFYQKKLIAGNDSTVSYTFSNISNGKWALQIDVTGYYFPSAKVFDLTNKSILVESKFVLISLSNSVDYVYKWEDDSSYLGHAQQSYINGQPDYKVINDPIKVPDNFSSINLIHISGIALSNKLTSWSSEDAYRLYQMVKRVPLLNAGGGYGMTSKAIVKSVWSITDDEVVDDISVNLVNGIKYVIISRKAFVYATPLVAEFDGIKGRFFSKRLYNAVISFATNFGYDVSAVSEIANQKFGIKFLEPGIELKNLMNEDPSNFQSFSAFEKLTILSMFEELPDGMHIQANLKYIVHRIAGQNNPKYPSAAAIAWIGLRTIEFMQKAFNTSDYGSIQRLILHEKSHFLWADLFEQKLKDEWVILGGWYIDPLSGGWSTTNTTEFVSSYAHLKNPDEDMAETIATYVTNPNLLMSRSIRKYEFIRDRVMYGTRYVAMIRKDLTFTVYNLMPDYNYPGKITGVNINVRGLPNEDKTLIIELRLHAIDSTKDGAVGASTRIVSSIGTFYDIGLSPVNGNPFLLRGEISISKFSKNGYWTVNQIILVDAVGNQRFENNNTFGLKIFINNPLEDLLPPRYKEGSLNLSLNNGKFNCFCPGESTNGNIYQALKSKFDVIEVNRLDAMFVNFAMPTNEKGVYKSFSMSNITENSNNDFVKRDSIDKKIAHVYYNVPIPEYYPSGYYPITSMVLRDEAQNESNAIFMNDTLGFKDGGNIKKYVRDSILIKTKYPDYIQPILDINAITIKATPTNPTAPNGETLFEMEFFAKDSSDFLGYEAGLQNGNYNLRDPQGKEFGFSMQGDFNKIKNDFYWQIEDPTLSPGLWRKYKVKTLLPKGSAPGLWGVAGIQLNDRAQNSKYFNFVELVRFDLEKADSSLLVNPLVEILGKKVNAKNVDSVSLSISCKTCAQKNYRARFYSDMGGESVLYEGVMDKDSIVVKNIKLKGVNDGVLYATVFVLDTAKVLLGIGKAEYTKDVVAPKSPILKTNLSNFGKSNIDSLIFEMKVSELKCEYTLVLTQTSIVKNSSINSPINSPITAVKITTIKSNATAVGDFVVFNGKLTDSVFKLKNINISSFEDGIIELKIIIKDSLGNETIPVKSNIYKDTKDPTITIKKTSITDLRAIYTIESNEFLSNSLVKDSLKINVGKIDSIAKVGNKLYNVFITRVCNDTLILTVKSNSLLDTVGNKNITTSLNSIEKLIPIAPVVRDTNYCNNASADTIRLNTSTGATLLWYGTNATGGTGSSTAIKPSTATIGATNYYLSQIITTTGCEGPRSKIAVTTKPIPSAPILSRDTANYLLSGATGTTWYKDGAAITDTNQKYKPATPGSYTAKTTTNGCISVMSAAYYYLVTDIISLSKDEFIKLAPNPFINQLNFDFIVKGYQKLNLEVFDLATGSKVATQQNITAGTQIQLSQLARGTYIIRVTSNDNKIMHQFKVMKL